MTSPPKPTSPSPDMAAHADGPSVLDAFPRRRIIIYYAGTLTNSLLMLGLALLFAALALFSLGHGLPDMARDASMQRAGKSELDPTAEIDGHCRRVKWIFIDCTATISYRPDPADQSVTTFEQNFLFLGTRYDTTVDVLRSTVHPERVTTTLATAHLGNRIVTLLLVVLILGGVAGACLRAAWVGSQRRRLEGKSLALQPLLVSVTAIGQNNQVSFKATIDGRQLRASNRLRVGDAPLYVGTQGLALAVAVPDSPYLILIDHDMTALAFTDAERAQIRMALS